MLNYVYNHMQYGTAAMREGDHIMRTATADVSRDATSRGAGNLAGVE